MKRYLMFVTALLAVGLVASLPAEAQKGKTRRSQKEEKSLLGDGSDVAAKSGAAPQSQTVEPAFIPADPTLPTFFVTVEPRFIVAVQGIVSGGGVTSGAPEQSVVTSPWVVWAQTHSPKSISPSSKPDETLGSAVASQLLAALGQIGNVVMIEYETYEKDPGRFPGIFKIKGTVTQFNETDGLVEKKKGFNTGPAGVLINAAGNAFDVPGMSVGGQLINILNIGKKTVTTTRTGMVGINLQIVQMDTGRIFATPVCQGTFATQSATEIKHGLGVENSQAEYQSSPLEQASQMALNDAVGKIWEVLKRQAAPKMAEATPQK